MKRMTGERINRPTSPQGEQRKHLEALFLEHLPAIRRSIDRLCRRNRLSPEDTADFASWAMLRLIRNDYEILHAYNGDSRMSTYLQTVVRNLLRDFCNGLWGKWRPSARARRLGPTAVEIETLTHRDGLRRDEALELLTDRSGGRLSRPELEALADRLPPRSPRSVLERFCDTSAPACFSPDRRLDESEHRRTWERVRRSLARGLAGMAEEERRILRLLFAEEQTVAAVARRLGLDQRSLYTRRDRCLRQLRRQLEESGLGWSQIRGAIGVDDAGTGIFGGPTCR